jgi:hypothetical protein
MLLPEGEMAMTLSTMPVWLRLTLAIWLMLALALGGMIAWETRVNRETILRQAEDFSNSIHEMTMAGLTGMMITGTVGQREVFLDQIKELSVIKDLQVIRSQAVISQFGDGGHSVRPWMRLENEALTHRKEILRVEQDAENGHYLRVVRPTLASRSYLGKDCTGCHSVEVGTPLGLVSMKISLNKVDAAVSASHVAGAHHGGAALFPAHRPLRLLHSPLCAACSGRRTRAGHRDRQPDLPRRHFKRHRGECRRHQQPALGHEADVRRHSHADF